MRELRQRWGIFIGRADRWAETIKSIISLLYTCVWSIQMESNWTFCLMTGNVFAQTDHIETALSFRDKLIAGPCLSHFQRQNNR